MMIEAILFDLDGVLVDSYDVWFEVVNDAARHLGRSAISAEAFHAGWGQGVDADVRTWFEGTSVEELERLYDSLFPQRLDLLRVSDGVSQVFQRLRDAGIRIAVITNTPRELAGELLERAEVVPDLLLGGTDVEHPKPAPDMVLRACAELHVAPHGAVVVGDSRFDREAAGAAGVRFWGFGIDGERELSRLSEVVDHAAEENDPVDGCASAPGR